jgi:hypothetical protein
MRLCIVEFANISSWYRFGCFILFGLHTANPNHQAQRTVPAPLPAFTQFNSPFNMQACSPIATSIFDIMTTQ